MQDEEAKKAGKEHFDTNIWPNCTNDGVMNLDGYKKMMGMMAVRADEQMGDHVAWTEAE